MTGLKSHIFAFFLTCTASALFAQGTGISLSPVEVDADDAIEVTADNLSLDQKNSFATFSGNAKAVQGDLILSANTIKVIYNADQSAIEQVIAKTNVIFTNGPEVVEANSATYVVNSGQVKLTGNVMLLQGVNAISGDALTLDLETNNGKMSGNVKTIFVPKSNK